MNVSFPVSANKRSTSAMPVKIYSLLSGNRKCFCRLKWTFATLLLGAIGTFTVMKNMEETTAVHDTYFDDIPSEVFGYVMEKWFNYTGAERWFNRKNISMFDYRLLKQLREQWIISINNTNTYHSNCNFEEPHVMDPSMGQAQVIRRIFNDKKNGFFIECGAYDGETRSNTFVLERLLNWTGILIEADPINFTKMLTKNRRAYLSPSCLSIKSYPMNVSFLMAKNIGRIHVPQNRKNLTLVNTMDRAHHGVHVGVQCFPLASYIAALDVKTVDYFSLDVEGHEMDILETIPFDLLHIKVLSVEFTHVDGGRQKIINFMNKWGYYVHSLVTHKNNLANDIIFVKHEQK